MVKLRNKFMRYLIEIEPIIRYFFKESLWKYFIDFF